MRARLLAASLVVLALMVWWVGGRGGTEGRAVAKGAAGETPAEPQLAEEAPAPEPPETPVRADAVERSIRVIDEGGAPVPGAWIEILLDDALFPSAAMPPDPARNMVLADGLGFATVHARPGDRLFAGAPGFMRAPVRGPEVVLRRSYSLAGVVVDLAGKGIAGATLFLREPSLPERKALSGPDGAFAFDDVCDDEMVLRVSAEGFVREDLVVTPGDADVRVVLVRPVTVAGIVVFPGGRPAAGARLGAVVAAADGRFALPGVRPGRVELRATLRTGEALWVAAAAFEIGADPDPVRLVLAAEPRSWVNVRALERDGSPAAGVAVRSDLTEHPFPITDASGRLTLAVDRASGTKMRAWVEQKREDGLLPGRAVAITGRDAPEVVLRPLEPRLITVVVRDPDGAPLPRGLFAAFDFHGRRTRAAGDTAVVEVEPDLPEITAIVRVPGFATRVVRLPNPPDGRAEIRMLHRTGTIACRLVDEAGAAVADGEVWAGVMGAGGSYCVDPVDGVYRVDSVPAGRAEVRAGRSSAAVLARVEADVRAGEVTDLGTLVLPALRTLGGKVTDLRGRPVGGARVVAALDRREWRTFSRADGSFAVEVPRWFDGRVVASKPGYGAVHRPASDALALALQPEGKVRLEVRLPPITTGSRGWSLAARDPITGFQWPVRDRERVEGMTSILRGLPPGRLVLVVETVPRNGETEVMVVAGETVSATIELPE